MCASGIAGDSSGTENWFSAVSLQCHQSVTPVHPAAPDCCWCKELISLLVVLLKSDLFCFFFLKLNPILAPFQNGSPFHQPPLGEASTGHQSLSWLYHPGKKHHHFLFGGSVWALLGYFAVRQVAFAPQVCVHCFPVFFWNYLVQLTILRVRIGRAVKKG